MAKGTVRGIRALGCRLVEPAVVQRADHLQDRLRKVRKYLAEWRSAEDNDALLQRIRLLDKMIKNAIGGVE